MGWAESATDGLATIGTALDAAREAGILSANAYTDASNALGAARGAWTEIRARVAVAGGAASEFTGDPVADRALLQARGVAEAIESGGVDLDFLWSVLKIAAKIVPLIV